MATIKEVAKEAGVSVATVSRVINNNGYVNDETRKRVEKAIQSLNYQPNDVARSLFKKQSQTIGLMVPDIMNPFFPELARAVEDTASKLGYTVILCNTDEDIEKEQMYLNTLLRKYIDGLIVVSNTLTAKQIKRLNVPVVTVDREISKDIPTIIVQNTAGGRMATRYLKEIGCERIAHLKGPDHIRNANERCCGYKEEVHNEPWFKEDYIIEGHYEMESAIKATYQLLTRYPDIDGIFAGNDIMAIGAIKAVHQLGKKVPDDVAVIGFDGIALAKAATPELTTIAQPIYEMGRMAANLLIDLIEKKKIEKTFYNLEVELVKRQST
ncbi:LacI family DNA-binding transcriptional regulator [Fictibacillus sp. Mic-4]|uniref:LacI family DNA-binding transcriptional regulator n=1 Tax=Fictibacillus TaxID=1329200 RepID=UPI000410AE65|nr:LacI family DNA-binding transcriptional regulator [Fictibacillus gelatini]